MHIFSKLILFITFFGIVTKFHAQLFLDTACNQSQTIITKILPPNSYTSTPTYTNTNDNYYLCGPNTQLYDTLPNTYGCKNIFLNAGCKLIFKSVGCFVYEIIYAKNSSTVIIQSGTSQFTKIVYEPSAVIINQAGLTNTFVCTSLTFPAVNCGITSLIKNAQGNLFKIYPNPVNDKLTIEFTANQKEFTKAQIINSLGSLVKETDLSYNETKPFINLTDLPNGVYILNLKGNSSNFISKRFTIAK